MCTFVCIDRPQLGSIYCRVCCAPWWSENNGAFGERSATVSKVSIRYSYQLRLVYSGRVGPVEDLRARSVLRFYCPLLFSRYKGQYMKPPIWIEAATGRRR